MNINIESFGTTINKVESVKTLPYRLTNFSQTLLRFDGATPKKPLLEVACLN